MDVGFIGVGIMGSRMVANLIKGGHRIWAYDISPAALERAGVLGATPCGSLIEAAAGRDAVMLSLTTPEVVEQVMLGPQGVLMALPLPPLVVDTSTSLPAVSRRIAAAAIEKGCRFIDAPVSGGADGAAAGTLSVMVGGPVEAFESALPLLRQIGKDIFHIGDTGSGNTMKLVNNCLGGVARAAIVETVMMGTLAGLDPKKIFDVVSVSTGNSRTFQNTMPKLLKGDFEPGFMITLMHKDLDLASRLGQELGLPMPVVNAVKQVYQAAKAAGLGTKDVTGLAIPLERLMGVEIREKSC